MSFTKVRNTQAGSRAFGAKAKERAKRSRGGNFQTVAGQFEYLKLGETPIWLRFPEQLYTYMAWDRAERKVVEVVDDQHMEYATHYYPKVRRTINCSCGPFRKDPCFPCALEAIYWNDFREKEAELKKMGMEVKLAKEPPMRRSIRNAMAVLGVDRYFEVPLVDNKGAVRKNQQGETIMRFVAEPLTSPVQRNCPSKNGHNMHWSFSQRQLTQLERENDRLTGVCANCATLMHTSQLICADCGHVEQEFPEAINDLEDLLQIREEDINCSACHSNEVIPLLDCSGCGEPAEGGIFDFDLRLKLVPVDDKNSDLVLVGWRMPNYDEELMNLYQNPLNVQKILVPTPLKLQEKILGDIAQGIDPSIGAFTESYKDDEKGEFSDDNITF